jgi:hypothetical protein
VLLAAGRQRGRSTGRLDHAVAAGDEHPSDQRPDGGGVLDEQDDDWCHGFSKLPGSPIRAGRGMSSERIGALWSALERSTSLLSVKMAPPPTLQVGDVRGVGR